MLYPGAGAPGVLLPGGSGRPAALRWPHGSRVLPLGQGSCAVRTVLPCTWRLLGGSSAWRAGLTGSPGARGRSGNGSRRAACRPGRARCPGWWSCRSRKYASAAFRADDISPSCSWRRVRVRRLRRWRRSDGRPVGIAWRRRARRRAGSGRRADFPPSCKVNPIHAMQHDYINLGRGARPLMQEALGCPTGTHGAYLHENLIGAARRRPTRRCSRQPPSPGGAAGRRNGTGRRASRRPGRAP
jgi:hypothetical protein